MSGLFKQPIKPFFSEEFDYSSRPIAQSYIYIPVVHVNPSVGFRNVFNRKQITYHYSPRVTLSPNYSILPW